MVSMVRLGAFPPNGASSIRPFSAAYRSLRGVLVPALCGACLTSLAIAAYAAPPALPTPTPRQLFTAGERALAANHLRRARRNFLAVLRLRPQLVGAEINLGVIAERQRRWRAARARLLLARRLAPQLAGIELDLGLLDYRDGDYARAARALRQYLARQPASSQARTLLGFCQFFQSHYRPALLTLLPLWPQQRKNLTYLYVVSIAAGKARRTHLAHRAMRRLERAGAGSPALKLILARGYINLQQDVKALPLLFAARRQAPRLPFLHFCLGVIYQRQHKFAAARGEFRQDLRIEPDLVYDYEHLGQVALTTGHAHQAVAWFRQAVRRNPRLAAVRFGLGEAWLRTRHYRRALAELAVAQKLAPSSASVRFIEGRALLRSGHRRRAQRDFAQATRLRRQAQDKLRQEISGRHLPALPAPALRP